MTDRPINLAGKRLVAVLNSASGGCDISAPERMRAILESVANTRAHVLVDTPRRIERALTRAARSADVLIALGGDGTIRTAATICARSRTLLVPLPGGTMNMLPRALYGERPWEDALARTLKRPVARAVSGGVAGSEMFFCAAILGAPSLWAEAREAARRVQLAEAVRRAWLAMRRSAAESLDYKLDSGSAGSAQALAVICPLVSRAMDSAEPSLEVAAVEPIAAAALFRLAFHAIFDDWRRDPAISLSKVRALEARAAGRLPVILDGETVRLGSRVAVRFVPMAFRALVPASET